MKREEFNEIIDNFYTANEYLAKASKRIENLDEEIKSIERDRFSSYVKMVNGNLSKIISLLELNKS